MRQRLLLAAGWIVAAVGSGVVASGAVAIAGGQVLDRPLRPLTAAEVAALPVVGSEGTLPNEPLASGGSDSTSGVPPDGSAGDEATDPASDGSAGPGGVLGAAPRPSGPVSGEVFITTIEREPSTGPSGDGPVQSGIVYLRGGSASILSDEEGLKLLWARPSRGFVVSLHFIDETNLRLSFSGATVRYSLTAETTRGHLEITTAEEATL